MPDNTPIIVLLAQDLPAGMREAAQALSPRLRFVSAEAAKDDPVLLEQAEIIYGHFPPAWLERALRVRWVQVASAGVERLLQAGVARQAVFTTSTFTPSPSPSNSSACCSTPGCGDCTSPIANKWSIDGLPWASPACCLA